METMNPEAHQLIARFDLPDLRPEITDELHHAWSVARDEALLAYRDWGASEKDDRDLAYLAYVAAADREEAAARHFQRNVEANSETSGLPRTILAIAQLNSANSSGRLRARASQHVEAIDDPAFGPR
jgi:hypothetical protein